jgi:ferredoxin
VTLRLHLDFAACSGHGLCADLLPELVEVDEWGFPILRGGAVDPALLPLARRAVRTCPTLALRLVKTSGANSDRTSGPTSHRKAHRR